MELNRRRDTICISIYLSLPPLHLSLPPFPFSPYPLLLYLFPLFVLPPSLSIFLITPSPYHLYLFDSFFLPLSPPSNSISLYLPLSTLSRPLSLSLLNSFTIFFHASFLLLSPILSISPSLSLYLIPKHTHSLSI